MKTLAKTNNMSRGEWLEHRRKGIGGSDASVILGINQYKSIFDLWEDKTGQKPSAEGESQYTHFGHLLEPVVKGEFERRTGLKVRAKNAILQSDGHPFMLADLDGIVRDADGSMAVFEAKTSIEYRKGEWEKGVPDEYVAQVQHYMAVTGYARAYIAAIVGGNSYYCHTVERDESYIQSLIQRERAFWRCVTEGIRPSADGSKATADYLNRKYGKGTRSEVSLPNEAKHIVESYRAVDSQIKNLEERKTELSNLLKVMMKENEVGKIGEDAVVSWRQMERRSLDTERLRKLLGDDYDSYLKTSFYRRFDVA